MDPKHEQEFVDLKDALTSPDTMLYHPDWNEPFEIHTQMHLNMAVEPC